MSPLAALRPWSRQFHSKKSVIIGVALLALAGELFSALPPRLDDPVEGQKLALELRGMKPPESGEVSGLLRLFSPGRSPREVSLRSTITVTASNWVSRYDAEVAGAPTERLTIYHAFDRPTEYEWQRGEQVLKLSGIQATNHFAGSDFTLLDLGLEFFHWPTQLLAMREMRKSRGCDVLESRPARTDIYSRVLSWIDQESRKQGQPGLLMAEAYDSRGKILKEFEITGFKKVDGQYQVSEMEIRDRQAKTRTRLQFDFDKQ